MAAHFSLCAPPTATMRLLLFFPHPKSLPFPSSLPYPTRESRNRSNCVVIRVSSSGGDSYLGMWKNAVDRDRKTREFQKIEKNGEARSDDEEESAEELERKSRMFQKILEVPKQERDRVQRMQVIDRAAAAIAAARALLSANAPAKSSSFESESNSSDSGSTEMQGNEGTQQELQGKDQFGSQSETPGPNFWTWSPPLHSDGSSKEVNIPPVQKPALSPNPLNIVMEKEQPADVLSIPFESAISESNHNPPLPPLQSLMEVEKADAPSQSNRPSPEDEQKVESLFSKIASEAIDALSKDGESSSHGVNPDGSKWWKETGIERRSDGVVCKWTLTRGVSADESIEWEDKYWEAADQFDYKELGSEKSGRDAAGNVWRECWRESMWQDVKSGLLHIEKFADKWGKDGKGGEWQEKWWEHYDTSGQADKWAHKWCCIDPNTPLEPGHAHVWHERWGEKYDGQGGTIKYTDKWAERSEGDAWTKWGDKWDENFNSDGQGVKQGETWWEGKYGERWNRTWGEQHNGSGWVHKYGRSSSGEHWDTHVEEDTWYERYPHYGFDLCLQNSLQLREVQKPSETS